MPEQIHYEQDAKVLLNTLLGVLPDVGIVTWDAQGRITSLSEGCRTLMQLPASAAVGGPVGVIAQSPCKAILKTYQTFSNASGTPLVEEVFKLSRDGDNYWLRLSLRRCPSACQGDSAFLLIVRDITTQHRSIEWAQRAQGFFEAALRAIPDAAVFTDNQGCVTKVSAGTERIFGYDEEELQGKSLGLLATDLASIGAQSESDDFAHAADFQMVEAVAKNGRRFSSEVITDRIRDANGNRLGVVAVLRDVSERLALQDDLLQQKTLLDLIFRQLPFALSVIDTDRHVVQMSDAALALFGYSQEQTVKHSTRMLYPSQEEFERVGAKIDRNHPGGTVVADMVDANERQFKGRIQIAPLYDGAQQLRGHLMAVEDVTARVAHEEELHRYEQIVSASSDALVLLDRSHTYLAVNQAYLELWEKTRDEIIGSHVSRVVGERIYREYTRPALRRCFSGEAVSIDAAVIDVSGINRFVDVRYAPYRSEQGEIAGVLITLRDVTQRHLAELAMQESQQRIQQAGDFAEFAVWELDVESRRPVDDTMLRRLLGYSKDDRLDSLDAWLGVVAEPDRQRLTENYESILSGSGAIERLEYRAIKKNGDLVYLETLVEGKQQNGKRKLVGISRDITESYLSQLALRESEEKFRAIFDHTPIGVVMLAMEDGAIIDVNPAGLNMYGYERDEYLRLKPWEVMFGITPENFAQEWRRVTERQRSRFESEHRRKGGGRIHILADASCMQLKGRDVVISTLVDITKQKQLELRLREQQNQYRMLVESSNAILFAADPETLGFRFVSAEAEKLLGYPVSAWSEEADFWLNHMHPDDRRWVPEYCSTMVLRHRDHDFDYRMIAADGRVVWLHDSTSLVVEEGRVVSLVGVMMDISAIKEAEAERWRLSEIVEQSADAILLTDTDFRITYINESFMRLYGYSLEDIRGRRPEILNAEPNAEAIHPEVYNGLRAGQRVHRQLLNSRKDGSLFHCQHNIMPLWNDQGDVIAYMSSQRDVSMQMKAELALRESEEKYRQIVETAHEGIWVLDVEARTVFVNPRMAEMLGYMQEEMVGRFFYEYLDETGKKQVRHAWNRVLEAGKAIFELCYRRKAGSDLWCHVSVSVLMNDRGETNGAMALLTDISEQRQLTEALIRSQKMEAVGQLTGGIAHDFNNILGSILGFTELAQSRFGVMDPKLTEYLRQIETAGGRARDLIRQLLIFSRGENTGAAAPIPLTPLIKEVVKMLMPMLSAEIEIRSVLPQDSPSVKVEPLHVQQLLMNLCINARDAIDKKGLITIEVARRSFDGERCALCNEQISGEWVGIRVTDTGRGIDESIRDDMFQPFITSKEVGEGSGMGLPVVRGIINSYSGHLVVESTPGQGTSFEILLHEAAPEWEEQDRPSTEEAATPRLEGVRLLLVDDEAQFRAYCDELLRQAGTEVVACDSGKEALRKWQQEVTAFDLIVSDQSMPGMSGIEMVKHLRDQGCDTPVILCSGYGHELDREMVKRLHIVEILQKPVSRNELLASIWRTLDSERSTELNL